MNTRKLEILTALVGHHPTLFPLLRPLTLKAARSLEAEGLIKIRPAVSNKSYLVAELVVGKNSRFNVAS